MPSLIEAGFKNKEDKTNENDRTQALALEPL